MEKIRGTDLKTAYHAERVNAEVRERDNVENEIGEKSTDFKSGKKNEANEVDENEKNDCGNDDFLHCVSPCVVFYCVAFGFLFFPFAGSHYTRFSFGCKNFSQDFFEGCYVLYIGTSKQL